MTTAPRHRLAVDALELYPGHHVLEIGCGHGVTVGLVVDRIGHGGHVHAIDRSAAMIERARRRNAEHVRRGVASFEVATIQSAPLPRGAFDRALAVRVRDLWSDPTHTLPGLRRSLVDGGRLVIVMDTPSGDMTPLPVERLRQQLLQVGFEQVSIVTPDARGAVAVVAHVSSDERVHPSPGP